MLQKNEEIEEDNCSLSSTGSWGDACHCQSDLPGRKRISHLWIRISLYHANYLLTLTNSSMMIHHIIFLPKLWVSSKLMTKPCIVLLKIMAQQLIIVWCL